jgi:hypothetical protein
VWGGGGQRCCSGAPARVVEEVVGWARREDNIGEGGIKPQWISVGGRGYRWWRRAVSPVELG